MKRLSFLFCFFFVALFFVGAQSMRDDFIKSTQARKESYKKEKRANFDRYSSQQNKAYADYLKHSWELFDNYKKHTLPYVDPKLKEAPVVPNSEETGNDNDFVVTSILNQQPQGDVVGLSNDSSLDIIVDDNRIVEGPNEVPTEETTLNVNSRPISVNFYGENLLFNIDNHLFLKLKSASEGDVSNYFLEISKYINESALLWQDISRNSSRFGLNEWGDFLLVKSLSEKMFDSSNQRVAFAFYMLRNGGSYKTKIARGSNSQNLLLMMAIDNTKEVYQYGFFTFKEANGDVRYYLIYGDGVKGESVYTYEVNEQDINLNQMKLDFDKTLAIGKCDKVRQLKINRMETTINLPFNSKNIAFLDDIPLTVFPIYFTSAMTDEAKLALDAKFGDLKRKYLIPQAVDVLLNFVQTAFDYKTDADQFGREKYFYPEESIAYPYCDCEDRSALFGWLVKTYLDLPVIGLEYPNHLATAVCLGKDVNIEGDAFMYGGNKFYVCDPTYIGASIGMTMPQYKTVTPKVIKIKK